MKKRVMSAAVLVAIVVILFVLPANIAKYAIAAALGIVAALAYKEIIDLRVSHKELPNLMVVLGLACTELLVFNTINASYIYNGVSYAMIGLTILLLAIPSIFYKKDKYTTKDAFYLIGATVLIGLFFNLLMLLFNGNKWVLLYLVLVSTMTDTFAMLIGCLIGKHKLIPSVSPKKSVEGSVAGSLLGTIIASIYYVVVLKSTMNIVLVAIMTLLLTILGQIGDLFFSKIKRENDIKDFSNIMPGHGGILDRFDSLTFIVFGYVIIMVLLKAFM